MSRKLHRGRTRVFHKRNTAPFKILGWILAAVLIVTGGYFGAKFILEEKPGNEAASSLPVQSDTSAPAQSQPPVSAPPESPTAAENMRAFYLPLSALRNAQTLEPTLDQAAGAGFNAVLFDLKDSEGRLYYQSGTALALQADSAAEDALTLDELKTLFQTLKSHGLTPLPRLYAFLDPLAPRKLSSAKIATADHPTWTWYDDDPQNGGKPWLNPYSPVAHQYLIDLMTELKGAGADAILLDGVQFPKQTKDAGFGNGEYASLSKAEVLATFVSKAVEAMDGSRVLLSMPGAAALGTDTTLFGGNPVTFGASVAAPDLMLSAFGNRLTAGTATVENPALHPYDAIKAALSQIQLRLQVIDEEQRPALTPWLQGYDCTVPQIAEQIRAVRDTLGGEASYILYNPEGAYDFAALKEE